MESTIGEFLRSRRDRLSPGGVGLPDGGTRRRVAGLRREEVALLAGVSPDYYIRLEQGRTARVSDQVLDAVARALSLSGVESEHLRNLVRGPRASATGCDPAASDEPLARLLETMTGGPALLLDTRFDIVAWNTAAEAVFGVSGMARPRNPARHLFLHPEAPGRYGNWAAIAAETVAQLRLLTGRWPDDIVLTSLIRELSARSEAFRRMWATGDVREKRAGIARLNHPGAGPLEFEYHMLTVPARADRTLMTYLPRA